MIFEAFYVLATPNAFNVIGIGALVGFVGLGLVIGALSGIEVLTVGLNEASIRIVFILAVVLNLMFQFTLGFNIGTYSVSIPVGIGLLYPTVYDVFFISNAGFLGLVGGTFITIIAVVDMVAGLLMAGGVHD